MEMRFVTWNLWELGLGAHGEDQFERVVRVVRDCTPDVLAVQELHGPHAVEILDVLAAETGLVAQVPGAGPAIGHAGGDPAARFHVGLLWHPDVIEARSLRTYDDEMWHNLITVDAVTSAGTPVRLGSYHAPPFGRERRADEAERVVSAFGRPYGGAPAGIVGADWNSISADRVLRPGWIGDDEVVPDRWVYHQPDPYEGQSWSAAMIYQCTWEIDPRTGAPHRQRADRRPGDVLLAGGLRDTAALHAAAPEATCGHAAHDPFGARAIDAVRVTSDLAAAVTGHTVIDTAEARAASDHLPVAVTLELDG